MYDAETSTRTMYSYDASGRLLKSYNYKSGKILNATSYTYDAKSRVTSMVYSLDYIYDDDADAYAWTNTYTYDENTDLLSEMNISMSSLTATLTYNYDGLNMLDSKTAAFFHNGNAAFYNRVSYEYGNFRTSNVYSYTSETGRSSTGTLSTTEYNFTYDENGNITLVRDGNGVIQNKYYYDNLGQLIREDNRAKNKTYVWTYDNAGNRTSEKTYALTTGTLGAVTSTKNYSYSTSAWGDLLTFDGRNYITYDEIGNPTRIYQDDGGFLYGYELTWEGRRLTAYTYFEEEGSYEYYDTPTTYTYNADGIRTSKTNYFGTKYEYVLDGSRIVSQTWGDNIFVFIYDENGSPIGINYTSAESNALDYFVSYYFEKNLQGDIIAIYNSSGTKVGTYTYDAWGNVTQTYLTTNNTDKHIVNSNPFRYRGYYYDSDIQLYYLQTRYYNPANGRFLNADGALYSNMLGFNLFVYCYNNPISYMDSYGESATAVATWTASAWWLTLVDGPIPVGDIIFLGGVVVIGISTYVIADKIDDNSGITFEEDGVEDDQSLQPLPDPSEVDIDIDHIMQEHHPNGGKDPKKDKFAKWMTKKAVEKIVKKAYQDAYNKFPNSINKMQIDKYGTVRYRIIGKVAEQKIHIWVDTAKKIISTAYPK